MQDKGQSHLIERLPKSLGHGMGLELKETGHNLTAKNSDTLAKAGMVFHLHLGALSVLLLPSNGALMMTEEMEAPRFCDPKASVQPGSASQPCS